MRYSSFFCGFTFGKVERTDAITSALIAGIFLLSLAFGCKDAEERKATKHAGSVNIRVIRLDVSLFESPLANKDLADSLKKALPHAYRDYFAGIARIGNPDSGSFSMDLAGFRNDYYMKQLYEQAVKLYGKDTKFFRTLLTGLGRYNFYFPEKPLPAVVVCITALNYAVAVNDSTLFVGLDMYLGPDFEAYLAMNMPSYIRQRRSPEYLTAEVLRAWLLTEFPLRETTPSFVDNLVYHGRIMLLLEKLLPETPPHILMGYTEKQYAFCEENKRNIWRFFLDAGLFQSRESRDLARYFEEAPFSYGMPNEVPGRTGIWLGWQILKSFTRENPQVSLDSLMKINDLQNVFLRSGFRP